MASTMKKRKVAAPLSEQELNRFIDDLDNDDGLLSDSEILLESEDDISESESDVELNVEEIEDVRLVAPQQRPRKNLLRNFEETLDENNYDQLPPQDEQTFIYTSRDKKTVYDWKTVYNIAGRIGNENIIRNKPGPTPLACRADTPEKMFDLFFTDRMIVSIVTHTNRKINDFVDAHPSIQDSNKYPYCKNETTVTEIRALFGLIYIRGALHQGFVNHDDLFHHASSNKSYTATMGKNRFRFLLRVIQFDYYGTRRDRWTIDRFAAAREIFNKFNENCATMRIPSEFLSIDETLYPYRGKIQFRQYNPNKPAKYGLLYRSLSDAKLPYTYFTLPYAGKPEEITDDSFYVTGTDNYTKYLVDGLSNYCDIRGRNISMDRFFTSMTIAKYLLSKDITVVGTLRTDRIGIPTEIKQMNERESPSSLYVYNEEQRTLLVSYVIKKKSGKKNVLVLSTMHKSVLTSKDERQKPHIICFYDRTKGGVDVMDMMAGTYSSRYKSRRWTANVLAYMLDTARTNGHTIMKETNPDVNLSSFEFTWQLGQSLIKPHMTERFQNATGLQATVIQAMKQFINEDVVLNQGAVSTSDRKRCYLCLSEIFGKDRYKVLKNKLAKTKWVCSKQECQKAVCQKHFNVVCSQCSMIEE